MENNQNKRINGSLIYAIVGVMVLVIAVSGSAYAYYSATASNNTTVTGTAGGNITMNLTITKKSTSATGNLIPIDMTTTMLTNAAKGWNPTLNSNQGGIGTSWNASYACKDKNSYSVCQIYTAKVQNTSSIPVTYTIKLTSLSGTNTPNVDAVKMASNISVTDVTSLKNTNTNTICTTASVAAGSTSSECYFMVFIKNLNEPQTDNGAFSGVVTATSSDGGEIKARFS